jgi:hypothetical protein
LVLVPPGEVHSVSDLHGSQQIQLLFARTTQTGNTVTIEDAFHVIPVTAVIQRAAMVPLVKVDVGHTKTVYQVWVPLIVVPYTSYLDLIWA